MSKSIYNIATEKLFKEINNYDLNENFFGVYPFDKVNEFIIFERMMPGKKYSFLISNMERSDQGRTHWWSIMNILPKIKPFFWLVWNRRNETFCY